VAAILVCVATCAVGAESDGDDYLRVVRSYADAMIAHGRDIYGPTHSPLFAATLDRKTLRLPTEAPPSVPGIRGTDRTTSGANPMHDLNLYQVLYALTKITGQTRYAAAADQALKWFFEHCQSPSTGLFAWGEHLGWDFHTEAVLTGRDNHEFYRPWVLWDRLFELARGPCTAFAVGLWEHQIADRQAGLYSRHAAYARHGPSAGSEFPRHGGFYIATWAATYAHTKDPRMLQAIEVLVDSFERRRNKSTGVLPAASKSPDMAWPPSELSLAIDLWEGAARVPSDLSGKMRTCASHTDRVFLKLPHDLGSSGKGFVWACSASKLDPGDPGAKGHRSHTDTWATGYGEGTDAQVALCCLLRYRQVGLDGYRQLVLSAAERYLNRHPDASAVLYPGALAEAIALLLGVYQVTREAKYLERADAFGRKAVRVFFEGSPLPRASSRHEHYEAITRGDTLAMALLDLWAARSRPDLDLGFVWSDR